jgi:hypothetical protein
MKRRLIFHVFYLDNFKNPTIVMARRQSGSRQISGHRRGIAGKNLKILPSVLRAKAVKKSPFLFTERGLMLLTRAYGDGAFQKVCQAGDSGLSTWFSPGYRILPTKKMPLFVSSPPPGKLFFP